MLNVIMDSAFPICGMFECDCGIACGKHPGSNIHNHSFERNAFMSRIYQAIDVRVNGLHEWYDSNIMNGLIE